MRRTEWLSITALALAAALPAQASVKPVWDVETDARTGMVRQLSGAVTAPLGGTPEEAARAFLAGNGDLLTRKRVKDELVITGCLRSRTGHHVRFMHRSGGLPVLGTGVTVHLDGQNRVTLVTAMPRAAVAPVSHDASIPADTAIHAARTAVGVAGDLRGEQRAELALLPEDGGDRLVYRVLIPARKPLGDWEVLVDARTGAVLKQTDMAPRAHGRVFDPNPCVTLKNFRLAEPLPATAYRTVELQGLDGSGTLKGQYVDASQNGFGPATEPTGEFNYDHTDRRFGQVMVYYHLDRVQRYIQSLGFTNVNNRQTAANVHYSPNDNSFYSPITKSLNYGDGGVPDTEDADVVCHEYGHAIQDNQIPGFGRSPEAMALGEGFGDYLAGTVRTDQGFNPLALAIWDATAYSGEDPPNLRRLDTKKHYPEDVKSESHLDGEMWSASLWQIRTSLGAVTTDKLVLQAHFYLETDAHFADASEAVLRADREMNQGANQTLIRAVFEARGFLKPAPPAH